MRIAVVTWNRQLTGGVEYYLNRLLPGLRNAGHDVALFCEVEGIAGRAHIGIPPGTAYGCVGQSGQTAVIHLLKGWSPDLIYSQGVHDLDFEAAVMQVAPVVFFAHAFHGLCISGSRCHTFPTAQPCGRRFGFPCLWRYYPRRCGGLNPVTMWREYRIQERRRKSFPLYAALLTHSRYVAAEYMRHGMPASRIHVIPFSVINEAESAHPSTNDCNPGDPDNLVRQTPQSEPTRLLFLGRMDTLKGGQVLCEALPLVAAGLGRAIRVIFAGDGPARASWEQLAARQQARHSHLKISFVGWVNREQREAALGQTDLLVVPSLWPEPFGQVGPEAGWYGIPAAAFDVGGINQWLLDGINGYLAPGKPPTASGLATAIIKCLENPVEYARLRRGAFEVAKRFTNRDHLAIILSIFRQVITASTAAIQTGGKLERGGDSCLNS
jgi:glycosyltransferase involved in cell wall biosynthesis